MKVEELPEINQLSTPEKILFLEDLWESILVNEKDIVVPEHHKTELDKRLSTPGRLLTLKELQNRIDLIK